MIRYRQWRRWSVMHGCEVVRIMAGDDHGREYFVEVEAGRGFHDRRDSALEAISEAIERGDEPGEVGVMGLWPSHAPPQPPPQGPAPSAEETVRYEPME